MTRTGRPPKPHHLKVIEGNPGKRKLTPPPKLPPSKPRRPSTLSDGAVRVWNRVVPKLDDHGLISEIDGEMLALFAETYAAWLDSARAVAKGTLVEGRRRGEPVKNPAHQPYRDHARLLIQLSSMFGLSPSDRVRLAAEVGPRPLTLEEVLDL